MDLTKKQHKELKKQATLRDINQVSPETQNKTNDVRNARGCCSGSVDGLASVEKSSRTCAGGFNPSLSLVGSSQLYNRVGRVADYTGITCSFASRLMKGSEVDGGCTVSTSFSQ